MSRLSDVEHADIRAARAMAPARESVPVKLLGWLSELADQPQLISICAATTVFGLVSRDRRLARTGARMLAAELLATKLKSVVKHRVDRTRPRVPEDGGAYRMEAGDDRDSAMNSFPSGHTAGAVAVARALVRDYSGQRWPAYSAAAAVAAIQVPRCQHYPSDLAAGAALGLAAEGLVHAVEVAASRIAGAADGRSTFRTSPADAVRLPQSSGPISRRYAASGMP
ncbi:phosphatase PAP2 family protein [Sphingomonas sp.]|uniref:phosphatase PAP2 family protein n=1 Tax=Sphingomonas sp. TaxID=28214 RepID=UPI003B008DC0